MKSMIFSVIMLMSGQIMLYIPSYDDLSVHEVTFSMLKLMLMDKLALLFYIVTKSELSEVYSRLVASL